MNYWIMADIQASSIEKAYLCVISPPVVLKTRRVVPVAFIKNQIVYNAFIAVKYPGTRIPAAITSRR
jgi:hypothetical protein